MARCRETGTHIRFRLLGCCGGCVLCQGSGLENKITAGTSTDTFSPDATCTRAQIVSFLWRFAGKPEADGAANPFRDVSDDQYYYDAVLWAVKDGITAGTSADTFSPEAPCTRAQIVSFLYRYLCR